MDRADVVLVTARPILESIVLAALASEPDVRVVGTVPSLRALEMFLTGRGADLAIVDVGDRSAYEIGAQLLSRFPGLRVLTIAGDGRTATLHELRPHAVPLGEISPERLRQAIRNVLQAGVT
jgi:DNA-binding NarL/FixJ family response regulator